MPSCPPAPLQGIAVPLCGPEPKVGCSAGHVPAYTAGCGYGAPKALGLDPPTAFARAGGSAGRASADPLWLRRRANLRAPVAQSLGTAIALGAAQGRPSPRALGPASLRRLWFLGNLTGALLEPFWLGARRTSQRMPCQRRLLDPEPAGQPRAYRGLRQVRVADGAHAYARGSQLESLLPPLSQQAPFGSADPEYPKLWVIACHWYALHCQAACGVLCHAKAGPA